MSTSRVTLRPSVDGSGQSSPSTVSVSGALPTTDSGVAPVHEAVVTYSTGATDAVGSGDGSFGLASLPPPNCVSPQLAARQTASANDVFRPTATRSSHSMIGRRGKSRDFGRLARW